MLLVGSCASWGHSVRMIKYIYIFVLPYGQCIPYNSPDGYLRIAHITVDIFFIEEFLYYVEVQILF